MSNETGTVRKPRRTSAEIARIVAQFADSGLNRSEFCRRQGICLSTLTRHLKRVPSASRNQASDGLVAVQLVGQPVEAALRGGLTVVLSGGRRIEVSAGFDVLTLQRVVAALEGR